MVGRQISVIASQKIREHGSGLQIDDIGLSVTFKSELTGGDIHYDRKPLSGVFSPEHTVVPVALPRIFRLCSVLGGYI